MTGVPGLGCQLRTWLLDRSGGLRCLRAPGCWPCCRGHGLDRAVGLQGSSLCLCSGGRDRQGRALPSVPATMPTSGALWPGTG